MNNNKNQIQNVNNNNNNNQVQLTNEMQMVLPYVESYNQIFQGKREPNEAKHLMIVFAQKLANTFDKSGNLALNVCTQDSIRQVAYEILNKGLDLSKSQTALIVYGNRITLQDEYFGKISLCKSELGISIRGTVIRQGDIVEIDIDSTGLKTIKHKTKWENYNNPITGAWASAYDEKGNLVETDIMTRAEIHQSWLQSKMGVGKTHKNFENEMCRKTIEGRLAKHIYNKSTNNNGSVVYDSYDNEYEEEPSNVNVDNEVVDVNFDTNSNDNVVVDQPIQVVEEQPVYEQENNYQDYNNYNDYYEQPQEQYYEEQQPQEDVNNVDYTKLSYKEIIDLNLPIGTTIVVKYSFVKEQKTLINPTQKWNGKSSTYNSSSYTIEVTRIE